METSISADEFARSREEDLIPISTGEVVALSEMVEECCHQIDSACQVAKFGEELDVSSLDAKDAVVYEELGIVVLDHNEGEVQSVSLLNSLKDTGKVEDSLPEFYAFAFNPPPQFTNSATVTWGLQAIQADQSNYTGKDVRVAVLDTGIDMQHPEPTNVVASQSFVAGQAVDDLHGHGTHCSGIVAGPANPPSGRRYGVAPCADLVIGKVLSNMIQPMSALLNTPWGVTV